MNTSVHIFFFEIHIFGQHQVDQFEIGSFCHLVDNSLEAQFELGSMCHLLDDSLEDHFYSCNCNKKDLFKSLHTCCMAGRWCCLVIDQCTGYKIQYLEQILLLYFINKARKVVVDQNRPHFEGIRPFHQQQAYFASGTLGCY